MIELKALREADSAILYEWLDNRDYRLQSGGFEHISPSTHAAWFQAAQQRTDQVALAVRRIEDNALVGLVQLVGLNQLYRSAELRIRLAPSELGKGYGTKATQLLCQYAFLDLNLNRIFLHVMKKNTRAIRCYEKAGFHQEGLMREHGFVDGKYEDFVLLSILSRDLKVPT